MLNHLFRAHRLLIFTLLALWTGLANAQVPLQDTIIGSSEDITFGEKVHVTGNPLMNRLTGIKEYDCDYSIYFLECKMLVGMDDIAAGLQFAWVPKRWGGYLSYMWGNFYNWKSVGVAVRPSMELSAVDWHLYGGLAIGGTLGYELGMRFSAANTGTHFSWLCGSISTIRSRGTCFFTIGLSLDLACFFLL
ncbi:MAG: hypothetical protein IJV22_01780 [Bacteroidales bacterium]|nr:hypothetical protein [Bacteroidales bacterium]